MTKPLTLRHGDKSQAVQQLQWALNAAGAKLVPDGDFGDETEKAVRAYQLQKGLVADGVAGEKTLAALAGADCSRLLSNTTLVAAAKRLTKPGRPIVHTSSTPSDWRSVRNAVSMLARADGYHVMEVDRA